MLVHLTLFAIVSLAIVLSGTLHAEADDARALRAFPGRLVRFLIGCAILAGLVVLA